MTASRERLPDDRASRTIKLTIADRKFYATVGFYKDGRPGELFIDADAMGDGAFPVVEPGPLLDALATAISVALQYGAPLDVFLRKFRATRFEPSGITGDAQVPMASSPLDYLARKLAGSLRIDIDSPREEPSHG